MDININTISASEHEVEVTASYDEIKNDLNTEVKKETKKIQLPGFRKGKAPLSMIKKMYGDALEFEAAEKVANTLFWNISKERELAPIGQPHLMDIKFNPGENLFFKIKYEVMPQLEVKDYTGIEIEIPDFQVRDEDVDNEIKYMVETNRTFEDVDSVGEGNNYLLDVEITRVDENGEPVPGAGKEKLQIDLTNERVQPDIIENAKGKKSGETFEFSFKDEHTHKNEAGEETIHSETYHYKALINNIKKIVVPELSEELIKKLTKDKVSTESELRQQVKTDFQGYYDTRVDELTKDKLISLVIKNNDFVPPSAFINNVLEDLLKHEEEQQKKEGNKKFDRTEAANRLRKVAEVHVKWYIIRDAIIKKENITFTDEELQDLAVKDSEKTGIPVDKLVNYYKSSNYAERFLEQKLFDFLKEKNNIKRVSPELLTKSKDEEKVNE